MKNINWKIKSEYQQANILLKVVALFWFATKIWSYKTWIANRLYPVIPSFDFFKYLPDGLHIILFSVSLILLLVIVFTNRKIALLIAFFVIELFSCMLDTVRWQPWEYMYMCIFLINIINFHRPKNILVLIHLFLISMYLFSGLHKLNRGFLHSFWMNDILVKYLGISLNVILKYKLFFAGLIIPFFEILFAGLLVFSKNKRRISYFFIMIHLIILFIIGPFGLDYNSVVWFWNLALIIILMIVYGKTIQINHIRSLLKNNIYWLILWFFMPILSFFGRWYQYFSFNLYSGKGEQMYIYFSVKDKMHPEFGEITINKGLQCVNLQNWAMQEIKSVPIPEKEIYLKISDKIKKKYKKNNVKVILYNSGNRKVTEL